MSAALPQCAVCFEPAEGEIRIRRLGRQATVVLRLCATHTRRAYRALSKAVTADLVGTAEWVQRRLGDNPALDRAITALRQQADNTADGDRIDRDDPAVLIDFLLWEME